MQEFDQISSKFKDMLLYEREHSREKFIYDVNKILNAYSDVNENLSDIFEISDPQLLLLIFSLISITSNKDDLEKYIKNEDLYNYMNHFEIKEDNKISLLLGHTFSNLKEKNMNIGESFVIPEDTLSIYDIKTNTSYFNINDWDFLYDNNILSINNGVITSLRKGCTVIKCINKINNEIRKIKINSGDIKQSNITEFFFTQIRNIIAHGRFTLVNSGKYDSISEYQTFNLPSFDDRYVYGSQRNLLIYDFNQLNIAYDKNNNINPKYISYLAKNLYVKKDNPYIKFIDIFENKVDILDIEYIFNNFSKEEFDLYNSLIILSKFYINFIYNYDSYDKDNYNYDLLKIDNKLKNNLTNKEFIYEIRTSIMHGRYEYKDNIFNFWNTDKKDKNIKTFDVKITDKDLLKLSLTKEDDFYSNMKYDPRELEIVKKKRY